MTTLSDLITRLEAAKEGSRELNRKIAFAVNWKGFQNEDQIYRENAEDIPNWTQSLNAALTLVPEGTLIECELTHDWAWWAVDKIEASHSEPALALCIAALKAREAGR